MKKEIYLIDVPSNIELIRHCLRIEDLDFKKDLACLVWSFNNNIKSQTYNGTDTNKEADDEMNCMISYMVETYVRKESFLPDIEDIKKNLFDFVSDISGALYQNLEDFYNINITRIVEINSFHVLFEKREVQT